MCLHRWIYFICRYACMCFDHNFFRLYLFCFTVPKGPWIDINKIWSLLIVGSSKSNALGLGWVHTNHFWAHLSYSPLFLWHESWMTEYSVHNLILSRLLTLFYPRMYCTSCVHCTKMHATSCSTYFILVASFYIFFEHDSLGNLRPGVYLAFLWFYLQVTLTLLKYKYKY